MIESRQWSLVPFRFGDCRWGGGRRVKRCVFLGGRSGMKRSIIIGSIGLASILRAGIAAQGQTQPGPTYPPGQTMPRGQTSDEIACQTFPQIVAPWGAPGITAAEFETWASDQD